MKPFRIETYRAPHENAHIAPIKARVIRIADNKIIRQNQPPEIAEVEADMLNRYAAGEFDQFTYPRELARRLALARLAVDSRETCRIQAGECDCALGVCRKGLIL
jgi:hypothetical protein